MDYLQYRNLKHILVPLLLSFKPYYKWITFNTNDGNKKGNKGFESFKPYYKWITFNTEEKKSLLKNMFDVLNLIINGLPSIPLPKG